MAGPPSGQWRGSAGKRVLTLVGAALSSVLANGFTEAERWPFGLEVVHEHVNAAAVVFLLAAVLYGIVERRNAALERPDDWEGLEQERLAAAAAELRRRARDDIDTEVGLRGVAEPVDLPLVPVGGDAAHYPGASSLVLLGAALPQGPCRLVLLGGAGSGKSTALVYLAWRLAQRAAPDAPVPVVLNVSSWDPRTQHLDDLLRSAIEPSLRRRGRLATAAAGHAADDLVGARLVLPVLDGLDEVPQHAWQAVRHALRTAFAAPDRQFMVACSTEHFEELVPPEIALGASRVLRLGAMAPLDAVEYLRRRSHAGTTSWDPVVRHLEADPTGPLGRTLSSPLWMYLTAVVYEGRGSRVTELLDQRRFASAESIEALLLERYVESVYVDLAPSERSDAPRYRATDAGRWLAGLASILEAQGSTAFDWWRLPASAPWFVRPFLSVTPPRRLTSGISPSALMRRAGRKLGAWLAAVVAVVLVVLVVALGVRWWASHGLPGSDVILPGEGTAPSRSRTGARPLVGLLGVAAVLLAALWAATYELLEASDAEPGRTHSLDQSLRLDRNLVLARLLMTVPLVAGAVLVGLGLVLPAEFGGGYPMASLPPWLRFIGSWVDSYVGLDPGTRWLVASGVALALGAVAAGVVASDYAWVHYRIATWAFRAGDRLPPRLQTFLADAHRRGVLRQDTVSYAFRHRALQYYLASPQDYARAVSDAVDEASRLFAAGRPRAAFAALRGQAHHRPQARAALARLLERRADQLSSGAWLVAVRAVRADVQAAAVWQTAVDEGDPGAALALSDFFERRIGAPRGPRFGNLGCALWIMRALLFWQGRLGASGSGDDAVEVLRTMGRVAGRSTDSWLVGAMQAGVARELDVHRAAVFGAAGGAPVMVAVQAGEPQGLSQAPLGPGAPGDVEGTGKPDEKRRTYRLELSGVVERALRLAATASGGMLQTGDVLSTLADVDVLGDWGRFWMHVDAPPLTEIRGSLDDDPFGPSDVDLGDLRLGCDVSAEMAAAFALLERLQNVYSLAPVPAGALALAILAQPGSGAAQVVLRYASADREDVLRYVQEDLIGSHLPHLHDLIS